MPNLSNLLGYSRDFLQGMSNSAASNISAPVDGLAWMLRKGGMNIPPNPVGGSDWMAQQGLTQQPQSPLAGMLGETAGMLAPFGVAAKAPQIARGLLQMGENAMVPNGENVLRSMPGNGKIGGPKDLPIRSFIDDYPSTSSGNVGRKLTTDIEGNPLAAQHIAGRRIWGGSDEALSNGAIEDVSRQLGASIRQATPSDNIGRDLGRYVSGSDASGNSLRQILLSGKLSGQEVPHVLAHEVGHLIDDLTFGRMIPTKGIKKEGAQVYSDLNSSAYVPKGKIGATPETFKYSGSDIPAEINAESIRAYMQNPNYMKTVAPNMAKRIREFVNNNPNLNKTIQFNSAAGSGLIAADGFRENK